MSLTAILGLIPGQGNRHIGDLFDNDFGADWPTVWCLIGASNSRSNFRTSVKGLPTELEIQSQVIPIYPNVSAEMDLSRGRPGEDFLCLGDALVETVRDLRYVDIKGNNPHQPNLFSSELLLILPTIR